MDNELFELCKEVYKRTGWKDTLDFAYKSKPGIWLVQRANNYNAKPSWWLVSDEVPSGCTPLFTSDYLLEKLPVYSEDAEGMLSVTTRQGQERNGWMAYYEDIDGYSVGAEGIGESPLEALLRLTLELHEQNLLKELEEV